MTAADGGVEVEEEEAAMARGPERGGVREDHSRIWASAR